VRVGLAAALLAVGVVLGVGPARAVPGDLDPTFGVGGRVVTDFGTDDEKVFALLPQHGNLLAAGYEKNPVDGTLDFGLARYRPNGTLDPSFGSGGTGNLRIGFGTGAQDTAYDVVGTPGGKLAVAGISSDRFAVARLLANGQLDPSFSGDGRTTTAFGGGETKAWAFALRVQPDGKIVVAGLTTDTSGKNQDFALSRYLPNGALDPTFGLGGKVVTSFGTDNDGAVALLRQPDGKLIAVGTAGSDFATKGEFALARYLPNGTLDPSFGSGGKVTTSFGARASAAAAVLQPDGSIVVLGGSSGRFALARYLPSGALDASFGSGGKVTTSFGNDADGVDVSLDLQGRIVAVGTLFSVTKVPKFFLVARYTPAGSLDTTFTLSGVVRTTFGDGITAAQAGAIQGDKILVAGFYAATGWNTDFALARFQGGTATPPPPPPATTTTTTGPAKRVFSIADTSVIEGTRIRRSAVLLVSLSAPAGKRGARVRFSTRNDSALAGADYLAESGTIELARGESSARITVPIISDATRERTERFFVLLSDPDNATIGDGKATVRIIDDD
jgi:uncharacterized delta-60 repeat protein